MNGNNGGSLLDTMIAGAIMFYMVMVLIILFPLSPGAVIAYEISKELTTNSDIHKLSIIIGMVINVFVYMIALGLLDMDIDKLRTKIYVYIFTIVFLMFLNNHIVNPFLQAVNNKVIEIIKFFLDFDRWFVDNTLVNMGLIALYAYVSFWIIGYVIKFISDIFKPRQKYIR